MVWVGTYREGTIRTRYLVSDLSSSIYGGDMGIRGDLGLI